jgi:hypothetical protein
MLKVALNTIKQANKQSSKKTYKVVSNLIQTLQSGEQEIGVLRENH